MYCTLLAVGTTLVLVHTSWQNRLSLMSTFEVSKLTTEFKEIMKFCDLRALMDTRIVCFVSSTCHISNCTTVYSNSPCSLYLPVNELRSSGKY